MLRSCRRRGWLFNLQHRGCKILLFVGTAQLLCTTIIYYLIGFGSESSGDIIDAKIVIETGQPADVVTDIFFAKPTSTPSSTLQSTTDALSKLAKNALNRAKTQECKDAIFEIDRQQKAGQLYSTELLKGSCPARNISNARFIGCFRDNINVPDLDSVKTAEFLHDNNPNKCIEYCFSLGLPYAGLQRGVACNCGTRFGRHGALPLSRCDRPCPGNVTAKCGGNLANSVYSTETGTSLNFVAVRHPSNSSNKVGTPAKIAFVLSLNGRSLRQIGRLLRLIYRPEHVYFIHIDVRLNYLQTELTKMTEGLPNVHIAEGKERFSTIWGGASLLKMLLSSYQYLVERTDWNWDYAINLSETDFPIRPIDDLAMFLGANLHTNFVLTHTSKTDVYLSKQGMFYTFFECENRMWRLNDRSLPRGIRMFGASDWVTLTREFVDFIINGHKQSDPLLINLLRFFNYTLLPAESYFHTVSMNTHFCDKVANSNLRVVNWQRARGCRCQQKAIVDWCGCSPNDLLEKDFRGMQQYAASKTPSYFFARKFEEAVDQKILNLIEFNLLHSLSEDTPAIDHFWLSEFSLVADGPKSESFLRRQSFYLSFAHLALRALAVPPDQPAKSECPVLEVGTILSAHSLSIRNVFQGILVEFTAGAYTFEVMLSESEEYRETIKEEKQSLDTITNPALEKLFASWGYRVAAIAVGSNFDLKENIFRNAGSLIVTNQSSVCIALTWEKVAMVDPERGSSTTTTKRTTGTTKGPATDLLVSISSPDGIETYCSVTTHPADGVTCVCSEAFHLTKLGIWTVGVRSVGTKFPNINFGNPVSFVVLPEQFSLSSLELLSPAYWSLHDVCLVPSSSSNNDNIKDCFASDTAPYFEPCRSKSWSSYSADVKSLPKFH